MMTVHVLHAGDGYKYLTDQVATGDELTAGAESLSDYYLESGTPEGVWLGAGSEAMGMSGVVSEDQMKALFGERLHPNADAIQSELIAKGATAEQALREVQLGRRPSVFKNEPDEFDGLVKAAFTRHERKHGYWPSSETASEIRKDTASRYLARKHGGVPPTEKDLRKFFAERKGRNRQPVAGYDLVFTPTKSVSVLWGLSNDDVRNAVRASHTVAVRETLSWLEDSAAIYRVGNGGIAQEKGSGFVATAFDHFDSRAGDPNLHTHVAIANVVQGQDGKYRALDGRQIHSYGVAASERYNAIVEREVSRRLGVDFEYRSTRRALRPVREVVGIDPEVTRSFSKRSAQIVESLETQMADYKRRHGVEPSRATVRRLAQEANLSTRQAKEKGVSLGERIEGWNGQLEAISPEARERLTKVSNDAAAHLSNPTPQVTHSLTEAERLVVAREVVSRLEDNRSTWHLGHVHAETQRTLADLVDSGSRGAELRDRIDVFNGRFRPGTTLANVASEADVVAEAAVRKHSLSVQSDPVVERPSQLYRLDGSSKYRVHGKMIFTSSRALEREDYVFTAATRDGGPAFNEHDVSLVAETLGLSDNQQDVAVRFATSGKLVDAAVGPAGAGKTRTMSAFVKGVEIDGGTVVGLAPSAVAADVLQKDIGTEAMTVAKFLTAGGSDQVDNRTIILVDEAGMTDTRSIAEVVAIAESRGAAVRLIGDPRQLAAVQSGGMLRLLERTGNVAELTDVHRFVDENEAIASLQLRKGNVDVVDHYVSQGRVHGGSRSEMLETIYGDWLKDVNAGEASVMVASSNDDVLELNLRAQADRVTNGDVKLTNRTVADGAYVGVGDVVVTRNNDYRNRLGADSFVKNGDRWTVNDVRTDGSLSLRRVEDGNAVIVAGDYVDANVELAYASTIHRVQGMTVAHSRVLVDETMHREALYVGLSRGAVTNSPYVVVAQASDVDPHHPIAQPDSPAAILRTAISTESAELSARESVEKEMVDAYKVDHLLSHYEDAAARFSPAVDNAHVRDVMSKAFGDHSEYITGDRDGWRDLATKVTALENAGKDPVAHLRSLASPADLRRDIAPAMSLSENFGEIGPGARTPHPELNEWLGSMERVIQTRLGDADAIDSVPRGRDLQKLREAWGVRREEIDSIGDRLSALEKRVEKKTPALDRAEGLGASTRDAITRATVAAQKLSEDQERGPRL